MFCVCSVCLRTKHINPRIYQDARSSSAADTLLVSFRIAFNKYPLSPMIDFIILKWFVCPRTIRYHCGLLGDCRGGGPQLKVVTIKCCQFMGYRQISRSIFFATEILVANKTSIHRLSFL